MAVRYHWSTDPLAGESRLAPMVVVSGIVHSILFLLVLILPGLPSKPLINALPQYTPVRLVSLNDFSKGRGTTVSIPVAKAKQKIIAKEPSLIQKKLTIPKETTAKLSIPKETIDTKKPTSLSPQPAQTKTEGEKNEHLSQKINSIREKVANGGGSVTAVAAGPKGGMAVGDVPPEMTVYTSIIIDRIMQAWFLPPGLKEEAVQQNLLTIIGIRIGKSGEVVLQGVEQSSSNSRYDGYAMAAIKKIQAQAFPPLPAVYRYPYLDLGIRFHPSEIN
ncbi:MAG: TonB C-terminal domain-containing protein [Deltaproteobacteria bacterium]|nr:TonB C-terminal domain-containing protein [Deltaproteobacteria bacterium]